MGEEAGAIGHGGPERKMGSSSLLVGEDSLPQEAKPIGQAGLVRGELRLCRNAGPLTWKI